jgi:hypothetical protein
MFNGQAEVLGGISIISSDQGRFAVSHQHMAVCLHAVMMHAGKKIAAIKHTQKDKKKERLSSQRSN